MVLIENFLRSNFSVLQKSGYSLIFNGKTVIVESCIFHCVSFNLK